MKNITPVGTGGLSPEQCIKLLLLQDVGCKPSHILEYQSHHPLATLGSAIDDLFYLVENGHTFAVTNSQQPTKNDDSANHN